MKRLLHVPNPAEYTGEIRFEGGQEVLVIPHADLSKAWPQDAYIHTMPQMPSHEVVLQYAANRPSVAAKRQTERQTEPLWATLSALLGGLLCVAVGLCFILLGLLW